MIKPYKPTVSFEDIWKFKTEDAKTYTAVPIVNAMADALYSTTIIECKTIAERMELEPKYLNIIMKVETGMTASELLHSYRFRQVIEYVKANPDEPMDAVAKRFGYSSYGSLWRFTQRIGGVNPDGKISMAGEELWVKWRKDLKKGKLPTDK